jgi:cytochrome c-type biogenesis protein CcmH/NrfG
VTEIAAPPAGDASTASAESVLLQARKRDLYAAIRTLARDRDEGTIDETAYRAARERYEREAAGILERLDTLAEAGVQPAARGTRTTAWPLVLVGLGLVVLAVALFLVGALRARGTGTITGSQPAAPTSAPVATAVPAQVLAARKQTRLQPRSVSAWLALGNAYLSSGTPSAADGAFRTAGRLAPGRPEAPTLDALALAAEGKVTPALRLLTQVERAHPTYARAWLTDGLIASRRAPGVPRAIRAWKRFLALQPNSPVSAEVRSSLRTLEQEQR